MILLTRTTKLLVQNFLFFTLQGYSPPGLVLSLSPGLGPDGLPSPGGYAHRGVASSNASGSCSGSPPPHPGTASINFQQHSWLAIFLQIESWLLPRRSESVEVEELESPLPPSLGLLGQVVVIVVIAINGHH